MTGGDNVPTCGERDEGTGLTCELPTGHEEAHTVFFEGTDQPRLMWATVEQAERMERMASALARRWVIYVCPECGSPSAVRGEFCSNHPIPDGQVLPRFVAREPTEVVPRDELDEALSRIDHLKRLHRRREKSVR